MRRARAQDPANRISRRAAIGTLAMLAWEARALAQTPPGARRRCARRQCTAPGSVAAVPGSAPDWPRVIKSGETTIEFYLRARFLGRPPTGGAQRGQHPGLGRDAAGVRRGRLRGRHAGGQGRAPVTLENVRIEKVTFPSAKESGGGLPEAPPAEHLQGTHARAGSPGDCAVDERAEEKGESKPLKNDPPKIVFSTTPGHPRPDRRRAEVRASPRSTYTRVHEPRAPHAEGPVRGRTTSGSFDGWLTGPAFTGPWTVAHTVPGGELDKLMQSLAKTQVHRPPRLSWTRRTRRAGRPSRRARSRRSWWRPSLPSSS